MFTSTKSEHKLMISKANSNVVPMRDERCENQRDNCSTDLEMRERIKGLMAVEALMAIIGFLGIGFLSVAWFSIS